MAGEWNFWQATEPFFKPIADFTGGTVVANILKGKRPENAEETFQALTYPLWFAGGGMIGGITKIGSKAIPVFVDVGKGVIGLFKTPFVQKAVGYGVGLGALGVGAGVGLSAVSKPVIEAATDVGLVTENSTAALRYQNEKIQNITNYQAEINKGIGLIDALYRRQNEINSSSMSGVEGMINRYLSSGGAVNEVEPKPKVESEKVEKENSFFGIPLNSIIILGLVGLVAYMVVKR